MSFLRALVAAALLLTAGAGWVMQTPPEEAKSNAAAWLNEFGLSSWGEGFTVETDTYIKVGVYSAIALTIGFWLALEWRRRRKKRAKRRGASDSAAPDRYVSIRDAIEHFQFTVPHSYVDGEMFAFESLHKQMCAGKLRVIGSKGEGAPSKRIKARECRNRTPIRVLVPANNPSTPHGKRYSLLAKTDEVVPLVEYKPGEIAEFTGLRVRSDELYRLWPKNAGT